MKNNLIIPKITLPRHRAERISSQFELISIEDSNLPIVAFRLVIRGGAAADKRGKEGHHRLTAKLIQQGAGKYSADSFAYVVESRGGSISVHTTFDAVIISAQFLSKDAVLGLELLATMLKEPRFSEREFSLMKRKTAGEIVSVVDEPSQLCGIIHNKNLFGNHPYGRRIIGYKSSVDPLTPDDVRQLHQDDILKSRMQLTIAGDIDTDKITKAVRSLFSDLNERPVSGSGRSEIPQAEERMIYLADKPGLTQAHIRLGSIGLARNDPWLVPLKVTSTLFGGSFTSRLNEEIRVKRGLTYGIHSSVTAFRNPGPVQIATFTKNESAAETIRIIMREMDRLQSEKPDERELLGIKKYMIGLYPFSLETNKKVALQVSDIYFHGLKKNYIDTYCNNIAGVTSADVLNTARKFFSADIATITILGDAEKILPGLEDYDNIIRQETAAFID